MNRGDGAVMDYNTIINDDCLHAMQGLEENSIDSIVTDPPYGLSFMGKDWDHGIPGVVFWQEALRIAKPGCHLLAFGGTRTFHRLAVAIEDAGWEIRDTVMWVYGSGFPKSLNIGKAVDKITGAKREVVGAREVFGTARKVKGKQGIGASYTSAGTGTEFEKHTIIMDTKGTSAWEGYGTALKPAWEPVIVARKPIDGTVANNVLKWGTGGINIDACRVPLNGDKPYSYPNGSGGSHGPVPIRIHYDNPVYGNPQGRFPANLIHDGSDEVVSGFPNDTSRFFYCAKASKSERNMGCEGLPLPDDNLQGLDTRGRTLVREDGSKTLVERWKGTPRQNNHPTVKPLALMRYLCRLVTPPDGVVLDPFCGSGSTLVGALQEGFRYIGIEKDPDYVNIAYARTKHALKEWGRESRQQVLQEVVS